MNNNNMQAAQELNDTIALQLGRLIIENQALRFKIAELTAKLAENQKDE